METGRTRASGTICDLPVDQVEHGERGRIRTVHRATGDAALCGTIRAGVVLLGHLLARWIGERGLVAIERLMGMFLVAIAVEMLLSGLSRYMGRSTVLGN
jgi:small neutral amino acid transporter SnatA (MarC family)